MGDTKERILSTALELFAKNGYEAVSVSDIAGILGMTKGALYRHYASKRAIFDSILARMAERDRALARQWDVPEESPPEAETTLEGVLAFSRAMFRYWTEDAFAARFGRMLTLEQFRSEEMGRLYQQYLASGPLDYVAELFSGMGIARPRQRAAEFYGPMYLLYSVYDASEDKQIVSSLLESCLQEACWKIAANAG